MLMSACETPRTYSVMWLLWIFNVSNKLEEIQQRSVDCDLVKRGQQQLLHAYVVRAQTQKALVCNWTKHMRKSKHHKYQNVVGQCTFASMLQVHSKWTYSFNSTKWLWFKHTAMCVIKYQQVQGLADACNLSQNKWLKTDTNTNAMYSLYIVYMKLLKIQWIYTSHGE